MRKLTLQFVAAILISLTAALAWQDTAPYRAAVDRAPKDIEVKLARSAVQLSSEIDRYRECNRLRQEDPVAHDTELTQSGRDCLLTAMPQIRTSLGAQIFAFNASLWLDRHPEDVALRNAALDVIRTGRKALLKDNDEILEPMDAVLEARNQSILLRAYYGKSNTSGDQFNRHVRELYLAEYEVLLPSVMRQQAEWRLSAYRERASANN